MSCILVVDDDAYIRDILKTFLEKHGYSVMEASNGKEAIALCKVRKFGLLIVDIFMPKKDGIEFLEELFEYYPDAKAIAISGGEKCQFFTSTLTLSTAVTKGALYTLQKPFDMNKLLGMVKKIAG